MNHPARMSRLTLGLLVGGGAYDDEAPWPDLPDGATTPRRRPLRCIRLSVWTIAPSAVESTTETSLRSITTGASLGCSSAKAFCPAISDGE